MKTQKTIVDYQGDVFFLSSSREVAVYSAAPELLKALEHIIQSAPLTGLPLALELDIQKASTLISNLNKVKGL